MKLNPSEQKWRLITTIHHQYGTIYKLIPNTKCILRWRHNGRDIVSNHQPHHCLLNCLFRRRSKKTSKLRVTSLCAVNSPGTGEFPAQMASNAENVSIRWRHHDCTFTVLVTASANLQPLAGHKRCHEIETLYKLLALCGRNPPIIVESYHTSGQYLTQSYDVLSIVSVNKTVARSWVVGGLRGRNYHETSL